MRYFDFHCHILLKQLFAEHPDIEARILPADVAFLPKDCTDMPNILQAQTHQSQLAKLEDDVMVGAALYGLESYLAREVFPLRKHLRPQAQDKMWETLFNSISGNVPDPPYQLFDQFTRERTLDLYLRNATLFKALQKEDFDSPLPKGKIYLFFVIEGCHSLVNSTLEVLPGNPLKKFQPEEILQNLDQVLQQAPVLSVNLTHIQQSNLCNHAFGMQLANAVPFYPHGNGLTADGRQVVQGLFDRGVNVDVKHMSYKSRQDLYQAIDKGEFQQVQQVLCTHAGFTGIPFSDWTGYIHHSLSVEDVFYLELAKPMHSRNNPPTPAPAFNLSTINLFDEEIRWIVRQGGMIGLSMDRRILGYVDQNDQDPKGRRADSEHYVDKEFFSKAEWSALGLGSKVGHLIREGECVTDREVEDNNNMSPREWNEFFYDHIFLQLKHFLQVCVEGGIDLQTAQKHITLGTDYDGMINPFVNMATVEDMPALKAHLLRNFGTYLQSLKDSKKWAKQLDVPSFVEGLFYENGYRYVKNFFTQKKVA